MEAEEEDAVWYATAVDCKGTQWRGAAAVAVLGFKGYWKAFGEYLGNATNQQSEIVAASKALAQEIGVKGLINIQFAISQSKLYVIEANPRASRTVPFVSKATGVQVAKAAALIACGKSISDLRSAGLLPIGEMGIGRGIAVKEAVLPWNRFRRIDGQGVDSVLGPEMKSTGEVMGIAAKFGAAFAKSQIAAFGPLPRGQRRMVPTSRRVPRRMTGAGAAQEA